MNYPIYAKFRNMWYKNFLHSINTFFKCCYNPSAYMDIIINNRCGYACHPHTEMIFTGRLKKKT
jgi:hypothetical protein